MIKKIYIVFFLSLLITSCGKKDNPIYEENKQKPAGTELEVVQ